MTTPRIAILLDNGFEIAEAMICIDILRRTSIHVDIVSCSDSPQIISYFDLPITTDTALDAVWGETYDAVLLPGGPKGTDNLSANPKVIEFIKKHINADKYICALCSAGPKVLAAHQLLGSHKYTASLDLREKFPDGQYIEQDVVIDGQFITGRGLGVSFEFALTIATTLHKNKEGKAKAVFQAEHIYFKHWS